MKFSVIIPVYNCEEYIENCLESIINQSYKKIEIIVVDDGSTDNTLKIVNKMKEKDSRIQIIHQSNSGVSVARNVGLSVATGEYVHFVDADDTICNDLYEYANGIFEKENVDVIRFNYIYEANKVCYNNKYLIGKDKLIADKLYINNELIPKILNEEIKAYVWQIIFKNNRVPEFAKSLKILEDEVFTIELLENSNYVYLTDDVFYKYNILNENSATKSSKNLKKMMNNMIKANEVLKEILEKYKINNNRNLKILDSRMAHSFSNYFEILYKDIGTFREARREFDEVTKDYELKKIFCNMDYNYLEWKHRLTTFATFHKQYFILYIIYYLKKAKKDGGKNENRNIDNYR